MKKFLLSFLCLIICIATLCTVAQPVALAATTTVACGKCGDNLKWSLNSGGELTVSGTGEMYDYNSYSEPRAPWYAYETSIKTATVKSGVTSIGEAAFAYCRSLKSISLPSTLKSIGSGAFMRCESLESITIPGSVSIIDSNTFYYCLNLTTVSLPSTVKEIGNRAFENCPELSSINIPSGIAKIGDYAFRNCSSLTSINLPDSVTYLGEYAFTYCTELSSVRLSKNITKIQDYTFYDCEKLTSVTIPNGVTDIGYYAFGLCMGLYGIVIPDSVTNLDIRAFSSCNNLTYAVVGSGISSIGSNTFFNCYNLKTLTLPASVKTVEKNAFDYCIALETVFYGGTSKSNVTVGDGNPDLIDASWHCNAKKTTYNSQSCIYCAHCKKYYSFNGELLKSFGITTQPKSVTVAEGKTAKVTVTATGDGLTYKWYFKNKGAANFSYTSSFKGNSYYVTMSSARDGRQVYCVVTDKYGNSVKSNTVTLSMEHYAKITTQPKSVMVSAGAKATVSVKATGDGLKYYWYFKNPGASKFSYTNSFTGNTYSVSLAKERSGRQVYCYIVDKYGNSVKSNTVTLTVGNAAKITAQPKSVTVAAGAKATVTVKATGDGLKYYWYFKNPGATKFSYTSSFTGNTYSVALAKERSGRQVYCYVVDKYGNSVKSDTVTLTVGNTAKITTQPKSVTVTAGTKATVTVKATGDGLTYKWYFKNPGATKFSYTSTFTSNTYSVALAANRSGRQVYCVVTDKYGNSVKSNTVTLYTK